MLGRSGSSLIHVPSVSCAIERGERHVEEMTVTRLTLDLKLMTLLLRAGCRLVLAALGSVQTVASGCDGLARLGRPRLLVRELDLLEVLVRRVELMASFDCRRLCHPEVMRAICEIDPGGVRLVNPKARHKGATHRSSA